VVGPDGRGQLRAGGDESADPDTAGRFTPTLFLYDNYPGGVGLSAPLFDDAERLVVDALELVRGCTCMVGCPACVGPTLAADSDRRDTPKALALTVLELFRGD
jgi:DEAD/DEAH box helicase domain-containing protein